LLRRIHKLVIDQVKFIRNNFLKAEWGCSYIRYCSHHFWSCMYKLLKNKL
jgi:hypothetical protein